CARVGIAAGWAVDHW
nr:immunoglobulin heavy chain junction region [Macaca mulatta]MOW22135.1 immunoglobulin heavy chain junction region [Macaca mulatta]